MTNEIDEFQQWRDATKRQGEYQRWLDREGFGRPQNLDIATRDELEQQIDQLRAEVARLSGENRGLHERITWLQQ